MQNLKFSDFIEFKFLQKILFERFLGEFKISEFILEVSLKEQQGTEVSIFIFRVVSRGANFGEIKE